MRLRLDKWYLDFQSGSSFAYWYVARLVLGRLRLVTVESHEDGEAGPIRRAWWGLERAGGPRRVRSNSRPRRSRRKR